MKNLNELTIVEALKGLKNKEFTCEELTVSCLNQIHEHNSSLNALLFINEEGALEQARDVDKKIEKEGDAAFEKDKLLGIPYVVKDNFCTKGVETTAASNILRGFIPQYESTVTKKIKDAGAVMLGKANMDAFAHGSSTETSDFGTSKNPWNTNRSPGGSSGGSAVAVAANMCIFAIGSETAGSIRGPASWCGVTGFKPTYGRVSRYGVIAMASSTDSPGPLTKTVEDSALVLEVIAGKDPLDATSSPEPIENYVSKLSKVDLKGLVIGVPKSYFPDEADKEVVSSVKAAIEKFKELGAEIKEIELFDPKYAIAVYTILQRSEVSSNLARFTGVRYGHDRGKFNEENKKRIMLGSYTLSSGYYDQYYSKAQKVRTIIVEDFNKAFEEVDLIVGPTLHEVALEIGASESSPIFGELMDMLVEPSAIAGLTAISIPCGFTKEGSNAGLPVGLQIIGKQLDESRVLQAAAVFQKETDFHTKFPEMEESKGD